MIPVIGQQQQTIPVNVTVEPTANGVLLRVNQGIIHAVVELPLSGAKQVKAMVDKALQHHSDLGLKAAIAGAITDRKLSG